MLDKITISESDKLNPFLVCYSIPFYILTCRQYRKNRHISFNLIWTRNGFFSQRKGVVSKHKYILNGGIHCIFFKFQSISVTSSFWSHFDFNYQTTEFYIEKEVFKIELLRNFTWLNKTTTFKVMIYEDISCNMEFQIILKKTFIFYHKISWRKKIRDIKYPSINSLPNNFSNKPTKICHYFRWYLDRLPFDKCPFSSPFYISYRIFMV